MILTPEIIQNIIAESWNRGKERSKDTFGEFLKDASERIAQAYANKLKLDDEGLVERLKISAQQIWASTDGVSLIRLEQFMEDLTKSVISPYLARRKQEKDNEIERLKKEIEVIEFAAKSGLGHTLEKAVQDAKKEERERIKAELLKRSYPEEEGMEFFFEQSEWDTFMQSLKGV